MAPECRTSHVVIASHYRTSRVARRKSVLIGKASPGMRVGETRVSGPTSRRVDGWTESNSRCPSPCVV